MRKIEREMMDALDHNVEYWQKDNTRVECPEDGWESHVYLHNNKIISICMEHHLMEISDCGWQTPTTKSRLNVVLAAYTPNRSQIYQRNHKWYLDYGTGDVIEMEKGETYTIPLVDINSIYGENNYALV